LKTASYKNNNLIKKQPHTKKTQASYNETIIKNKKEKEKNVGKDNFLLSVNIVVLPPAC
jgi:hypothetical protein